MDAQGNQLSTYEHVLEDEESNYELAERVIYGSSRLGINVNKVDLFGNSEEDYLNLTLGNKLFEMSNHLGNVLTVINDIKVPYLEGSDVAYYATIVSTADYSPFGVQLDGRTVSAESYRFGFQGYERDDEMKGVGNHVSFADYGYDPRIAKRLRTDPLEYLYPWVSPYAAFANNPLFYIDIDGRKVIYANKATKKMFKEIYKNGTPEIRAKIKALKQSDVTYNLNFYATSEHIQTNTSGNTTGQEPLGVTNYDFAASKKANKDIVNVFVADNDLNGYDRRLVAVNEIGGAYDFEVGNVGYAQAGNQGGAFAFDVGDEYDQAMDVIAYAEKNNIELPRYSSYTFLKHLRDDEKYESREQKLEQAIILFNYYDGYTFEGTEAQNPEMLVEQEKNNPGAKGVEYVYRKDGSTVKGKIE